MTERIMEESKTKKRTSKFSLFFFVLLVVVKIKKINKHIVDAIIKNMNHTLSSK